MEALFSVIGLIGFFSFAIALSTLLNGWALSVLWGWFMVGIFELPGISVGQAIGISVIVNLLTYTHVESNTKDKKVSELVGQLLGSAILRPLFAVLVGWLVYRFMM